jgi:hypothetical protein
MSNGDMHTYILISVRLEGGTILGLVHRHADSVVLAWTVEELDDANDAGRLEGWPPPGGLPGQLPTAGPVLPG